MANLVVYVKDALLCLLICSTLVNMLKKKKQALVYLGLIVVLFLLGLDI